jgi:hypothetical protein
MNQTESKLYSKYRHYLATENRHGTHAAERRQNARAKVVAEFNVPYAEVKRIVAEGDKLAGITHEAPKEVDPFNGLEIKRVPVSELQVGDRVKYVEFFWVDARVIAIDGYKITYHGLRFQQGSRKEKGTFTYDYTPENFNGAKLSVPVVVNRERRVPAIA